jgi:hypothetical protein
MVFYIFILFVFLLNQLPLSFHDLFHYLCIHHLNSRKGGPEKVARYLGLRRLRKRFYEEPGELPMFNFT